MSHPITLTRLCRRYQDPAERLAYFRGHVIETDHEMLPDTSRARGSLAPVRRFYRPLCRGVVVGEWHSKEQDAVASAYEFLKRWDGRIREQGQSSMTRYDRLPANCSRIR